MLPIVMYHHINSDDLPLSNSEKMMEAHLALISEQYTTVFPGDTLNSNSICLTFDDAYYDFYYYVFPLLKKYNLKALLAVPVKFIVDSTILEADRRLSLNHAEIYTHFDSHVPFCTYEELREMVDSGHVKIASHSMNHVNLSQKGINIYEEIVESKKVLESKLECLIDSFVLPFGKYNDSVAVLASQHYPYVFRIGNALNPSWAGIGGLLYRIKGDALETPDSLFKPFKRIKFWIKTVAKMIKGSR